MNSYKCVTVTVDRPKGSRHPRYPDMIYPVNYGYVKGVPSPDGMEQDAYILGVDESVELFTGKLIAVISRKDDIEEKWVVCPLDMTFCEDEIVRQTYFQEKYFCSSVRLL